MQLNPETVMDALNMVLSWDLSDEACSDAVATQACLLSGMDADDIYGYQGDTTFH